MTTKKPVTKKTVTVTEDGTEYLAANRDLLVYLSGPMTIDPDYAAKFTEAAAKLRCYAVSVLSPLEMDDAEPMKSYAGYLRRDIVRMLTPTPVDAVVVLPGWEKSKGCGLEVYTAVTLGMPVFTYPSLQKLNIAGAKLLLGEYEPKEATEKPCPGEAEKPCPVPLDVPYGSWKLNGCGPDAPQTTNEKGGKQSGTPYRFDLVPPLALGAVAEVCMQGSHYGEWNWTRITPKDNLNHALMHITAFQAGDTQEGDVFTHAAHAATRVLFWLDTLIREKQTKETQSD